MWTNALAAVSWQVAASAALGPGGASGSFPPWLVFLRPGLVESLVGGVQVAFTQAQEQTAWAAVSASIAALLVLEIASEEVGVIPSLFLGRGQ